MEKLAHNNHKDFTASDASIAENQLDEIAYNPINPPSTRQLEVLALYMRGYSYYGIATTLLISESTVKNHLHAANGIRATLGAKKAFEAYAICLDNQFYDPIMFVNDPSDYQQRLETLSRRQREIFDAVYLLKSNEFNRLAEHFHIAPDTLDHYFKDSDKSKSDGITSKIGARNFRQVTAMHYAYMTLVQRGLYIPQDFGEQTKNDTTKKGKITKTEPITVSPNFRMATAEPGLWRPERNENSDNAYLAIENSLRLGLTNGAMILAGIIPDSSKIPDRYELIAAGYSREEVLRLLRENKFGVVGAYFSEIDPTDTSLHVLDPNKPFGFIFIDTTSLELYDTPLEVDACRALHWLSENYRKVFGRFLKMPEHRFSKYGVPIESEDET